MSRAYESGYVLSYQNIAPRLGKDVFIAPTASVIGDVEIGDNASVWFSSVVRGDEGLITIGRGSNLQDGVFVHTNKGGAVVIGEDVTIGHGAIVHGCTIESGALIGMGAVILDGVVVESGAQIAAGAVVSPGKVVKAYTLWGGCPAKPMRELSADNRQAIIKAAQGYCAKSLRYLSGEVQSV